MKIKVLVIEIGIKNIALLKKSFSSKNAEILYASSFLDVVDIIHLDKVHGIIFSDFRGVKSTIGYIKMFKTTNPDFRLILLSNEKKIDENSKVYFIQRGAENLISCYDIETLNNYILNNFTEQDAKDLESEKWSSCTKKVIRCLKDNYHRPNLTNYISSTTEYSVSAISHSVKKDTGESFSDWVQKLRVKGALELLKSTNYSIKVVSNHVGYKTIQGLYKAFKKITGNPPTYFKN